MRAPLLPIGLLLTLVLIFVVGVAAQNPQAETKPPVVEWADLGGGWVKIDQVGDGMSVALQKKSITVVVYHGPDSHYARTVYREKTPLVIFNILASEYRVRCPDEKTAADLIRFILGTEDNGER